MDGMTGKEWVGVEAETKEARDFSLTPLCFR